MSRFPLTVYRDPRIYGRSTRRGNIVVFASDSTSMTLVHRGGGPTDWHAVIDESAPSVGSGGAGPTGPVGPQGPAGSNGAAGAAGAQGVQGVPGSNGAAGSQGIQGAQGLPGANGNDGAPGAAGTQGIQGPPGSNGATGPAPAGTGFVKVTAGVLDAPAAEIAQADVTGLVTALSGKAAAAHAHAEGDVTGLTAALAAKSAAGHGHAIADTTGLQAAIDGKAAVSHTHAQADVTNLVTDLASKAAASHTHAAGAITGLATVATSGSASDLGVGTLPIARVAANAVTLDKLARGATSGQVLTAQGAGADPIYAAVSGSGAPTKAAAATVAAGTDITWLVLAANSGDITGTGLVTVMTITGVGVGRYRFKCMLVYQATALTTGIDVAANHTGTTTQWLAEHRFSSTGQLAATAAAAMNAANAAGNVYESQGNRTKNAIIGAGTVSVDTVNADMMSIIEGFFVVSVTGSLEIKLAAEAAGLVCRAMQGSSLELHKYS